MTFLSSKPRKPMKRTAFKPRKVSSGLKTKSDPELEAWAKEVKARDGYKCQWTGCTFWHDQMTVYVAHHKALRSARPDLRLVLDNGTTVCWSRHEVIHSEQGRDEAVKRGFLNLRTMEFARAEGTIGIR